MKRLRIASIQVDPYLSKRAISTMVRDADFEPLKAMLDEEVNRLVDRMDNLDDDDEEDDNFGFPKDEATAEQNKERYTDLNEICEVLEQFSKQLILFHLISKEQIYSWKPPLDRKGQPDWYVEVGRPVIRPLEYGNYKLNGGVAEGKTTDDSCLHYLFRKEQNASLPLHTSVEYLYDRRMATLQDLEKRTLTDNLDYLKTLYEKHEALIDPKISNIPRLFEFFEKPSIAAARRDEGIVLN